MIAQNTSTKRNKKTTDVEQLMTDDRFKMMFEDEEFKRDAKTEAYKNVKNVSNSFSLIYQIDNLDFVC